MLLLIILLASSSNAALSGVASLADWSKQNARFLYSRIQNSKLLQFREVAKHLEACCNNDFAKSLWYFWYLCWDVPDLFGK